MFEKQYLSWQKKTLKKAIVTNHLWKAVQQLTKNYLKKAIVTNHVWKAVPKLTKNYLNKAMQLPIMFEKQYLSWLKITWKKQYSYPSGLKSST